MNTILFLIAAGVFVYLLIFKPEIIAVFFFTITFADINFDLGGLPLNIRAIVGISLFLRALVPNKDEKNPSFFSTTAIYILFFLFYTFLVTLANDLVTFNFIKTACLTAISAYCGYHYFFKTGDYRYFKLALIIAGLICFSDLVYTYAVVGKFPVQRVYMQLLNIPVEVDENGDFIEVINHGFYGLICGLCFVLLLNEFIYNRSSSKLNLLLLPLMFLGVLMSTSRSTLLGIIGIAVYLVGTQLRAKGQSVKAVKLIVLAVAVVILSLFLFATVKELFNMNIEFLDTITGRLVDEPVAVFYKHMGFSYNAQALDALEWRGEASSNAFDAYMELKPMEQVFGIGFWGFVTRNLGRNDLPPHNGMLLLLIESGLVGLCIYAAIVIAVIRKSFQNHLGISPLVTGLIFILIYCIGQNEQLTGSTTFLFIVSIVAENKIRSRELESQLKFSNA